MNPFDIVAVDHLGGSRTYGLVTNIRHVTDAAGHLANFVSNDFGELMDEPQTPRLGTNVADVAVLSNDQKIYMPVQNEALVRFADEAGVHNALGIHAMEEKEKQERRRVRISRSPTWMWTTCWDRKRDMSMSAVFRGSPRRPPTSPS